MDNNISDFLNLINVDLIKYRPLTTEQEKSFLIEKGIEIFKNYKPDINFIEDFMKINSLNELKLLFNNNNKNLFMCRLLSSEIKLPHIIPNNYEIFYETSNDIYNNYLSTLNNLNNELYNKNDLDIVKQKLKNYTNIFCWSNPSIILNKILSENKIINNLHILTFGSPVILPVYNNNYCINIYHEDDWIFKLLKLYYKFDFNNLEKDIIKTFTIDNNKCFIIILSRNHFKNETSEPHRCFNLLL